MHRIDSASATPEKKFTEGSPTGGIPATVVSATWLNDLQENVAKAVENAGIALVKGDSEQLTQAIRALVSALFSSNQDLSPTGRVKFPGGYMLQWGNANIGGLAMGGSAAITATFPNSFPNAYLGGLCCDGGSAQVIYGISSPSQVGCSITGRNVSDNSVASAVGKYFVWGK